MAGREFSLKPRGVPEVDTPYRRIKTKIPVPESLSILESLRKNETRSMRGQPPIIWERARGINIEDPYGNKWLDWSCGVLVTNVGHGHPRVLKALEDYLAGGGPLHTYCFPHKARADLVEKLNRISPPELDRVFLLTTGSEAVEVSIKLARTHGVRINPQKRYLVSFEGAFHGTRYRLRRYFQGAPPL